MEMGLWKPECNPGPHFYPVLKKEAGCRIKPGMTREK
jgi:hypothetical protein